MNPARGKSAGYEHVTAWAALQSRKIHCEAFKIGKRAVSESTLVRGAQDHSRRLACLECFLPARGTEAPTVTRFQARKAKFRYRLPRYSPPLSNQLSVRDWALHGSRSRKHRRQVTGPVSPDWYGMPEPFEATSQSTPLN